MQMGSTFRRCIFIEGLLLLSLLSLISCTGKEIRNIRAIASAEDPAKQAAQILDEKGRYYAAHPQQLSTDIKALKARLDKFKHLIESLWGEDDAQVSGPKDYVKYTDQYYNRAHINFETGTVIVETLAPDSQLSYLKKAIVSTFTPSLSNELVIYY